ncbi:hypothetical protein QR680_002078 [Steinernema hermaphroditum]|uniref:Uncharacterized protein n=1 Tax=Steinernema hermaphroditum TaxID=289476 RepID=A0AA39LHD8_9BILA|nr:hypothetical protein QR680_002078 [Steinernema hermaphroditum]
MSVTIRVYSVIVKLSDLIFQVIQRFAQKHPYVTLFVAVYWLFQIAGAIVRLYYYVTLTHPTLSRSECRKIVVITGASSGIGYETAALLYSKGATVFMLVRDATRAKMAVDRIKMRFESFNSKERWTLGRLHTIYVDLTSDASIRLAAYHILQSVDKIDVLINNAGIGSHPRLERVGPNRTEKVMQSNFFGHVLLTILLLPCIKQCSGRVINVSSLVYDYCDLPIDDLNFEKRKYNGFVAYSNSKCALIMMNRHLSTIIPSTMATFYSVDPGIVATPIGDCFVEHIFGSRFAWLIQPLARSVYSLIGKTTRQGCQTILKLCIKPVCEEENGEFFQNCSIVKNQSKFIRNKELCKDLWLSTVLKFYPAQMSFSDLFDVQYYDKHMYAVLLKKAIHEVDSDDDTLSICESDATLPCSSSVCGGRWCDDFGTEDELSNDSLFKDPRGEDDLNVSAVSLIVHPGKYLYPVEFLDEELEYRNTLFKRPWISDPGPIYDNINILEHSPLASLFSSESESAYYGDNDDEFYWSKDELKAYIDDPDDDDSLLYLFPRNIKADQSSTNNSSVADLSESSEADEGHFLSDSDIYRGLMQYKTSISFPTMNDPDSVPEKSKCTTPAELDRSSPHVEEEQASPTQSEEISSTRISNPEPDDSPCTLRESNEQQRIIRLERERASAKQDDPFADFAIDRFTYRLKTDPTWLKLFDDRSSLGQNCEDIQFTAPEPALEYPDISLKATRRESKLKKRWTSMKKLFKRS